jgi:hypothetical protein
VPLLSNKTALMSRSHETLDFLNGPPPEVLDEVAAAWERAQEPLPDGLALHFASEPALGRAWGELRLDDGELLTSISASEAIAIACGDALMAVAV